MRSSLSVHEFHQRFQKRLQLTFETGQVGLDRLIRHSAPGENSFEAVDFLNLIRPSSVVIIGSRESDYLNHLPEEQAQEQLLRLIQGPVSTFVLSSEAKLAHPLVMFCARQLRSIFRSEQCDAELLNNLRYYLNQALAEKVTLHGVFLDVHSIGTFITGDSGVGKSELALSLISRGHRLIADDITEFSTFSPGTIDGIHPGLSNDFMEVRGLGILNIRAMFGSNALRRNKSLRMIVDMVEFTPENRHQFDRLGTTQKTRKILGQEIPEMTLPVAPGRNLSVLVEAAARNQLLKMSGYNSADDFIERQRLAIQANRREPEKEDNKEKS